MPTDTTIVDRLREMGDRLANGAWAQTCYDAADALAAAHARHRGVLAGCRARTSDRNQQAARDDRADGDEMSASSPVPTDHPLMVAWTAYKATDDYANTKRWAGHDSQATDGSLWAAFERGWQAAGGRPPFAEAAAPPTGEAGTPLVRYGVTWNEDDGPVLTPMPDGYWTPWHVADAALAAPVPAAPPDLVALVRRLIKALATVRHRDSGALYCRYCAAKSPEWAHEPYCAYQESIHETEEARALADALAVYPLPPKENTNG